MQRIHFCWVQDGDALVEFPANFSAQVLELFGQWSSRYDTLKDWLGPRRYEETPIGQLLQETTDPKVRQSRIQSLPQSYRTCNQAECTCQMFHLMGIFEKCFLG
jgi:hypothetical protein